VKPSLADDCETASEKFEGMFDLVLRRTFGLMDNKKIDLKKQVYERPLRTGAD
jgi:hypothetical protein